MSGLVGFTGPPDSALLQRMLAAISHRGQPVGSPVQFKFGSFATCEWPSHPKLGQRQTECFHVGNRAWGLSGFSLNNPFGERDSEDIDSIIARTRGSFGLACLANQKLAIARDSVGCQSLYYGRVGTRWLIATEPKAITSERQFVFAIPPASIAQYLAFSFVPGRNTMLNGLFEAEAGQTVTLESNHEPQIHRYFRFEENEPGQDSDSRPDTYWIDKTRNTIEQAVAERLTDDEPAIFLSGGLDSSIIAAEVAQQSKRTVHTFAIHFGKRYPNELSFAQAVAERIGSRHHEILIQPGQFIPRLRKMIWHLDEPIGDPITQPNFELASIVSKNFGNVFNGEGGDPLFGGPKNLTMMMAHWYGVTRTDNFREQAYLASYRRAYDIWAELLTPDIRCEINPRRDLEGILSPFFETDQPRHLLNKLMAINIRLKGANLILPKVDRMLAAHGLTPLSPLFDDQLTRLSFEMPTRMKLRSGIEKYVLKRAYESKLPREVIERPKSGMRVPVHFWFQKEMRRLARSILGKKSLLQSGVFDPERVDQLLRFDTEEGPGRYGIRLWMLLTFESWRRIVIDRESV